MRVDIKYDDGIAPDAVSVTGAAESAVRFKFNPSGLASVNRLKALAAAFITECQRIQAEAGVNIGPGAARDAAVAITNMQTASMWGVAAATSPVKTKKVARKTVKTALKR